MESHDISSLRHYLDTYFTGYRYPSPIFQSAVEVNSKGSKRYRVNTKKLNLITKYLSIIPIQPHGYAEMEQVTIFKNGHLDDLIIPSVKEERLLSA